MHKAARFPKLLYSYLATEMLAPFFASFVVMNCVFFLVKLIPFLNIVLELDISFSDFVRLFCYLFPNMFLYSIPMSAMMGVIISFTRLSADTEILAFKASGISLYQMLPPVIVVAFSIATLTAFFSVSLIPQAETAMKQLMFQVAKEKIDKGIKEHQFTEALGDLVVYVESIDKESGEWDSVWVSDMRGQIQPIITMAQTGSMEAHIDKMMVTIILKNGSLHRPDGKRSQIISFDSYTINIPLQPPTILDGEDVTLVSVGSMNLQQLQDSATLMGRDTELGRDRLIHYHKRLALPVGCFILSLLGMPLGLQAGPGKKAVGIPLGLGFFIFYYILFTIGKTVAEDSQLPVFLAMWLPNFLLFLITLYFIKRAAIERPIIPAPLGKILTRITTAVFAPVFQQIKNAVLLFRTKPDSPVVPDILKQHEISDKATIHQDDPSTYLSQGTIHGNIHSHVFHLPDCDHYYCKDCTIEFKDVELAQESGFVPCTYCQSLLEQE